MAGFAVSTSKAGVNSANTVMWQLKSASSKRLRVKEVGLFIIAAPSTAPSLVLARHLTLGTSSATLTPLGNDSAEAAATAVLETAWSGAPTFTTSGPFMRLAGLPATAGAGLIWTFPEPILVPVSSGLQICNLNASGGTTGTFGMYIQYDE